MNYEESQFTFLFHFISSNKYAIEFFSCFIFSQSRIILMCSFERRTFLCHKDMVGNTKSIFPWGEGLRTTPLVHCIPVTSILWGPGKICLYPIYAYIRSNENMPNYVRYSYKPMKNDWNARKNKAKLYSNWQKLPEMLWNTLVFWKIVQFLEKWKSFYEFHNDFRPDL